MISKNLIDAMSEQAGLDKDKVTQILITPYLVQFTVLEQTTARDIIVPLCNCKE